MSVVNGSVRDFQTSACWVVSWVVITNNGKFAFVPNTGSGSISSYFIFDDGTTDLIDSVAGSTGAGSSAPIVMALNKSSHYLYVTDNGTQVVHSFKVEKDGSLTSIDNDGGLPFGVQGIAIT